MLVDVNCRADDIACRPTEVMTGVDDSLRDQRADVGAVWGKGLSVGALCLVAEHGHHAALGGVVKVVAVRHPLAGIAGVEVIGHLLARPDDHGVFARPVLAKLERVPVDVHRVVHRGGVGEDHPDPLARTCRRPGC